MDLLQSFLGCMYPGSIRTESLESIENDDAYFACSAANIDPELNEISRGELRLNNTELIYVIDRVPPITWPLACIRRYGSEANVFIFESGRRCQTGEGKFAFRVEPGVDLKERLSRKINCLNPQSNDGRKISESNEPETPSSSKHKTRDVSTSTDNQAIDSDQRQNLCILPLSYVLIDFDTTKALNDSAQAHAASRRLTDT